MCLAFSWHIVYYSRFSSPSVAQGDNVSHCMDLLGLSVYRDKFQRSIGPRGYNEVDLTYFVPTNEAMASWSPAMNSSYLEDYIVKGTVKLENLTGNGRFETVSGS